MGYGITAGSKTTIQVRFYFKGMRVTERVKMRPTKSNLNYWEKQRIRMDAEILDGTFVYDKYFPNGKNRHLFLPVGHLKTVEEALIEYLNSPFTKEKLQSSTQLSYKKAIYKHLIPSFGDIPLGDLKRKHFKEWAQGHNITRKSIYNILLPLSNVLHNAWENEDILVNPLQGWKPEALKKSQGREKIDPFRPDELAVILNSSEGEFHNSAQLAASTGLRPSEWLGLHWEQIDFVGNTARIDRALVYGKMQDCTKTEAGLRTIDLIPPAVEALKAQKALTFMKGGRVFEWSSDADFRKEWERVLKKAGVRYRPPKQLRHTWATLSLANKDDPEWVANQMGHTDWVFTVKTYTRYVKELFPDAGKGISGLWERIGNN